jgi:hypothetical protein
MKTMSPVCDDNEWTCYVGVVMKSEIRGTPTSKIQSILLQPQNYKSHKLEQQDSNDYKLQ